MLFKCKIKKKIGLKVMEKALRGFLMPFFNDFIHRGVCPFDLTSFFEKNTGRLLKIVTFVKTRCIDYTQ